MVEICLNAAGTRDMYSKSATTVYVRAACKSEIPVKTCAPPQPVRTIHQGCSFRPSTKVQQICPQWLRTASLPAEEPGHALGLTGGKQKPGLFPGAWPVNSGVTPPSAHILAPTGNLHVFFAVFPSLAPSPRLHCAQLPGDSWRNVQHSGSWGNVETWVNDKSRSRHADNAGVDQLLQLGHDLRLPCVLLRSLWILLEVLQDLWQAKNTAVNFTELDLQ